jgi:hypothetical protein
MKKNLILLFITTISYFANAADYTLRNSTESTPGSGMYLANNADNWEGGVLPTLTAADNVIIPAGVTIVWNIVPASSVINKLTVHGNLCFFAPIILNASWTTGSNQVTVTSTANLAVGMKVMTGTNNGTGIPINSTITAINSSTSITISNNATTTNTSGIGTLGFINAAGSFIGTITPSYFISVNELTGSSTGSINTTAQAYNVRFTTDAAYSYEGFTRGNALGFIATSQDVVGGSIKLLNNATMNNVSFMNGAAATSFAATTTTISTSGVLTTPANSAIKVGTMIFTTLTGAPAQPMFVTSVITPNTVFQLNASPSSLITAGTSNVFYTNNHIDLNGYQLTVTGNIHGNTTSPNVGNVSGAGFFKGNAASSLIISNGVQVVANYHLIIAPGTWGSITLNNSMPFRPAGTVALGNVTINSLKIGGTINVVIGTGFILGSGTSEIAETGVFTNTAGSTLDFANRPFIIKSSAAGTGQIVNNGTIQNATNVTVERFIPAKAARKWSFVCSPISASLSSSWQQQIHITGTGTGGTICPTLTPHTNGFDATLTNAPSMFDYDGTNTFGNRWTAISSTNSTNLTPGKGYRVNIRGPRAAGCSLLDGSTGSVAAATLSATGSLTDGVNTGNVTVTVNSLGTGSDGYVLVGNPYPAIINFNAFRTTNSSIIANEYVTYSPANPSGTYTTWNGGSLVNAGDLTNGQYIASGQAFFVQKLAAGSANLSFTEAHKAPAQAQPGTFRTDEVWTKLLRIGMKATNGSHLDEIIIRYSDDKKIINNALSELDAISLNEGAQKITSVKAKNYLAIQTRAAKFTKDEIALHVTSRTSGTFKLLFTEFENLNGVDIYLVDNYTNTTQHINNLQEYIFEINTNIPATQAVGRFLVRLGNNNEPLVTPTLVNSIKMYPNPATQQITVEFPFAKTNYTVRVSDISGKQVYQTKLSGGLQNLNIESLQPGSYIVEITDAKGNRSLEKLIKQ